MKKIWIIAVISALFMFVCGYSYLNSKGDMISDAVKDAEMINVVVAAQDIEPFTTLTSEMFTVKQTIANAFLTNFYTDIGDVVGSISTSKIYAGEVLTGSRISKDAAAVGLSAELTDGKRAITIEVDAEQGVSNDLKVGNYVDVIYAQQLQLPEANGQTITAGMYLTQIYGAGQPGNTYVIDENIGTYISVVALQNIKVVALHNANSTSEGTLGYTSVTLEVSPADAAKIALMNDKDGKIQLVLRPLEDNSTVNEARGSVMKKTQ